MRRRASAPKLLASSALLVAGLGGPVGAPAQSPRNFEVTVPVEVEHDSNPNMVVRNPRSTTWLRVRPTVSMTQVHGIDEYLLEGGLSAERSSNSDVDKDRVDPRLRAQWRHSGELNTGHVEAALDRRSFRSVDLREPIPIGLEGARTLLSLTGDWTRALSERNSVSGTVRQAWERSDVETSPDFRYTTASARFTHRMTERRSVYAGVNGQVYRSDDRLDPFAGLVRGSRSKVAGAFVGVSHQFTEKFRADANAGVVHFSEPVSDNDWQAAIRTEYTGERWQAGVDLSRSPGVVTTLGGVEVTNAVRATVRYAFDPLTNVDFSAGHSRGQAATSRRSLASVAVTRQLSPAWELSLRATRHQQRTLDGTAKANVVAVVLTYSVPNF